MTLREQTIDFVPEDMTLWISEKQLVSLALEATGATEWLPAKKRASPLSSTPPPVLRTLAVYAYARGIYCSQEIEDRCRTDRIFRYIGAGAYPLSHEIRSFRRANISRLEAALTSLLKLAFLLNLHLRATLFRQPGGNSPGTIRLAPASSDADRFNLA